MRLADVPAADIVVLEPGTAWRIPWESLMMGPFTNCALDTGTDMRLITAGAMVRSAVLRSSGPEALLQPSDYSVVPVFAPDMTLIEAAGLVVESGWEIAVVGSSDHKLLCAQTLLRSLLGTDLSAVSRQSGPELRLASSPS